MPRDLDRNMLSLRLLSASLLWLGLLLYQCVYRVLLVRIVALLLVTPSWRTSVVSGPTQEPYESPVLTTLWVLVLWPLEAL